MSTAGTDSSWAEDSSSQTQTKSQEWRFNLLPLLVLAVVAGSFKIRAWDLFWHLAAGRWILEHRSLPNPDPLRFTAEGSPWVDHEWLFQVGLALVEKAGGIGALSLLRIGASLSIALLLWAATRYLGASPQASALISGSALFIARPRFFLRPELLTLVILSLFLYLLLRFRRRPGLGLGATLLILVVLWANAHPAVLMAPVLVASVLVGDRLTEVLENSARQVPWWLVLGFPALIASATLVNLSGMDLWWVPLEISGSLEGLPGTNPEWLPMWKRPQIGYLLILSVLPLVGWHCWRRTRQIDLGTGLLAMALACLGATSVRQLAPFAVGATLFLAHSVAQLETTGFFRIREPSGDLRVLGGNRNRWIPWIACLIACCYLLFPPSKGPLQPRQGSYTSGFGLQADRFPTAAAEFVAAHPEIGNLYNNVAYGGYLLWRLYPPRTVFNDGRNELNPDFLRELAEARSGNAPWAALFERYDLAGALVRYDSRRRPVLSPPVAPATEPTTVWLTSNEVLFPRTEFALVHWDNVAMIFLRREARNRSLIEAFEYRFVIPEDPVATARSAQEPALRRSILREIQRKLLEDPESKRALKLLEALEDN